MAEKNELLEKRLKMNYLNIQKNEIEFEANIESLIKEFSKHKGALSEKLKSEQKKILTLKKQIKAKCNENLQSVSDSQRKNVEEVPVKLLIAKEKQIAELQKSALKHDAEIIKLDKAIENLLIEQQKQVIKNEKQYKADIYVIDKEIVQINTKATTEISNIDKIFQETKKQHEANMLVLSQDKEEEIKKISDVSNQKVKSMTSTLNKEEKRLIDELGVLKENLNEKHSKLENSILEVQNLYDELVSTMKTTLEAKIDRHQKFIDKSMKDNDQRAIKMHKKEIQILEKESEKEFKSLKIENVEKIKELEVMRKAMVVENLELIANKEKEIIIFKEERKCEIELEKASLESAVTIERLPTSTSLQDELNSYNKAEEDYLEEIANINYLKDLAIEQKNLEKFKLGVEFEKMSDINKIRHFEDEVKRKELKIIEIDRILSNEFLRLANEIEEAEIDLETNIVEIKLEKEKIENISLGIIDNNNLDHEDQKIVAKEYLEYQSLYKALYEDRATELIAYEEAEINNKSSLKIAFLESKLEVLKKEQNDQEAKINSSFDLEKAFYEEKREKASSEDQEAMSSFITETEATIKQLANKLDTLNQKTNKVEYHDLENELSIVRDKLDVSVKSMKDSIANKTAMYDSSLNSALARQELALPAIQYFYSSEIANIKEAIELINKHKDYELTEINERRSKITNECELLLSKVAEIANKTDEDIKKFNNTLNQKQNDIIKDANDLFDKQVFGLKANFDNVKSALEQQKDVLVEKSKQDISEAEQVLESKIAEFNLGVANVETASQKTIENQEVKSNQNNTNLEKTLKSEISRIANSFTEKEVMYRRSMSEIDKVTSEELKKLENINKSIKKDHETALQKQTSEINSKLQLDLKSAK